jgi:hypothetical protein
MSPVSRIVCLGTPDSSGRSSLMNVNPTGGASLALSNGSALVTEINTLLPPGQSLVTAHPSWITNQVTYDFLEIAGLTATYINGAASFQNSWGYFIYDTINPPASPLDLGDLVFPFPCANASGLGGALNAGDTIALASEWTTSWDPTNTFYIATPTSYSFPKGKSIGILIVDNGWTGTQIQTGGLKFWSIASWNGESNANKAHFVSLQSSVNTNLIYVGVEDTWRDSPDCDQSFADVNIALNVTPTGSFQYTCCVPASPQAPNPINYTIGYKKIYSNNSDGTISECLATLLIPPTAEIRSNVAPACTNKSRTDQCFVSSIIILPRIQQRFNMPSVEPNPGASVSSAHSWTNPDFVYTLNSWVYQQFGDDAISGQEMYGINYFLSAFDAIHFNPPV